MAPALEGALGLCVRRAQCLLLDKCPGCAQPHSYGDGDSCLPVYWGHVPEPTRCGNRVPTCPPEAPSREPCGQQLLDLRPLLLGNSSILAAQAVFEQALTEGTGVVVGEKVGGAEFFREARSLYSLLLHHGRPGDFPEMPAGVDDALEEFYRHRDEVRAGPATGEPKPHLVMYRRTLTNLPVMAGLAPTVIPLLASPSWAALSTKLGPLAQRVYARHGGRLGLQQYYGVSPRLEAALLAAMPRRRSRVWVKSELDRFADDAQSDPVRFARHVPPLLWPDAWDEHFSDLIPTRAHWPARRFLSMLLVKLHTQCSWDGAAKALGYQDLGGPSVAVGYVNRASREGTVEALRREAEEVAQRINGAAAPVDYEQRRRALATFGRIDGPAWGAVLARTRVRDTEKRRYCSAIWLWSELTGGYPLGAPGWVDTPPRAREMYNQFRVDVLPDLRPALLDYGRELLVRAGDSQPDRAELSLV